LTIPRLLPKDRSNAGQKCPVFYLTCPVVCPFANVMNLSELLNQGSEEGVFP
jgi:hypothetical protein